MVVHSNRGESDDDSLPESSASKKHSSELESRSEEVANVNTGASLSPSRSTESSKRAASELQSQSEEVANVDSGGSLQLLLKFRPSSSTMQFGYEEDSIQSLLFDVRCSDSEPPKKRPKLTVTRQKQLADSDKLKMCSLLSEQVEHQVTIYSLVEAARDALSGRLVGEAHDLPNRYRSEFEEIDVLGEGGFGHVMLCQHLLDEKKYAVKRIKVKEREIPERISREVLILSFMRSQYVVRYYQSWVEKGFSRPSSQEDDCARGEDDCSSEDSVADEDAFCLHIQMEFCSNKTLLEYLDLDLNPERDANVTRRLVRELVEGLVHIHSEGVVHGDIKPGNVFLDANNQIKIGDFGFARYLESTAGCGNLTRSSGQIGTGVYRAPEIKSDTISIDTKVDIYSLGVLIFELWNRFDTGSERAAILQTLKDSGTLPRQWEQDFPDQASLVLRLVANNPHDRPSAEEILAELEKSP